MSAIASPKPDLTVPRLDLGNERKCCVLINGVQCAQRVQFWIGPPGSAWDDWTETCSDHVDSVRRPDDLVERIVHVTAKEAK